MPYNALLYSRAPRVPPLLEVVHYTPHGLLQQTNLWLRSGAADHGLRRRPRPGGQIPTRSEHQRISGRNSAGFPYSRLFVDRPGGAGGDAASGSRSSLGRGRCVSRTGGNPRPCFPDGNPAGCRGIGVLRHQSRAHSRAGLRAADARTDDRVCCSCRQLSGGRQSGWCSLHRGSRTIRNHDGGVSRGQGGFGKRSDRHRASAPAWIHRNPGPGGCCAALRGKPQRRSVSSGDSGASPGSATSWWRALKDPPTKAARTRVGGSFRARHHLVTNPPSCSTNLNQSDPYLLICIP